MSKKQEIANHVKFFLGLINAQFGFQFEKQEKIKPSISCGICYQLIDFINHSCISYFTGYSSPGRFYICRECLEKYDKQLFTQMKKAEKDFCLKHEK